MPALTCKDIMFEFGTKEIAAMEVIKDLVIRSPALRPLNYAVHDWPIILAVDSSVIAVGYVLMQVRDNKRRYPSRFTSIAWTEHESRYSQAKLELYGLFRALRAYRICKGTSVHFLTSPLLTSTLSYPPGPHVHSPTLCTITRCQTLKAERLLSLTSPFPPPLLPLKLRTHCGHMGTGPHDTTAPSAVAWMPSYPSYGGLVLGGLVLPFLPYHMYSDLARDP
jgi:hypothetical protein